MRITSTRTLLFKVKGQQYFILRPSPRPTFAPDYIRNTPLFQLALKDGTIEDFTPPVAPVTPPLAPAVDDKAKADAETKDKKAK